MALFMKKRYYKLILKYVLIVLKQVDEDKKNTERMHELIEKLQNKVKLFKRQQEEAVHNQIAFRLLL